MPTFVNHFPLFGDKDKIKFKTINGRTRFERLKDGSIDVLSQQLHGHIQEMLFMV